MKSRKWLNYGVSAFALTISVAQFGVQAQTVQSSSDELQSSSSANENVGQNQSGQMQSGVPSSQRRVAQAQPASSPQKDPAANVETVIVTGARASVAGALDIKRQSTQIVDSIVAQDIGKLPDSTVVESLQHVSGISIIRNNVEPSQVLIRGLPDITTLLNGREIFSSTGRFVSLPDFPSELLARVDVHKTSSASDIEGGIAGLIDVRLHRPFDFDGLEIAGGAQAINTTLAGHVDPQASVLISDRWHTGIGEIGALVDVSFKSVHNQEDHNLLSQWTLLTAGPIAGAGSDPAPVCLNGSACPRSNMSVNTGVRQGYAALPNIDREYVQSGLIERGSANVSLQWRPVQRVEAFAELFYSRLRQENDTDVDVLEPGVCNDAANTSVYSGTNIAKQMVSSCNSITSMQARWSKENTVQVASGASWSVTDNFVLKSELDVTTSHAQTIAYIPDDEYNYGTDGLQITSNNGTGGSYVVQPGNPQNNPANMYLDQWYDTLSVARGSEWDWRADGEYDFENNNYLKSFVFGYRFADRTAQNNATAGGGLGCAGLKPNPSLAQNKYIVAAIASPACTSFNAQTTPTQAGGISVASLGPDAYRTTHGSFFEGKYGITSWVNVSPQWLHDNTEKMRNLFGYSGVQDFLPTNYFGVSEVSHAGYAKTNYAFDAFGFPVDGDFGARVIETALTERANSSSYTPATGLVITPVNSTKNDFDFLPSINVRVTLDDGLFLRLGASKTVTRPTFAQLNPGLTLNAANAVLLGTASSGNANLAPEKSKNYDVGLEYYWGTANHLSGAVFHRDVTGYIENVGSIIVVDGQTYNLTAPANVQNAAIDGAEVGYSQFLDFLPGFWSGFGWDVNGTYIDGVFNNLSKWGINTAGIYEQGPYSFRLSYTWRSSYTVGTFTGGVQPQFEYASPRENLDFSFNYAINDKLTVTLDGTNIINSFYKDHAGRGSVNALLFNTNIEEFDKTFSVGIRYRM